MSSASQRVRMPAVALDWMLSHCVRDERDVLVMGTGKSQINELLVRGHQVWALSDQQRLASLADNAQITRLNASSRLALLAAEHDALPLRDCSMDLALCISLRHPLSPRGVSELARVLRPSGYVSGARLVRDETVPWVQRLIALMQAASPAAMTPIGQDDVLQSFVASQHFDQLSSRNFRIWTEISRTGLIEMALRSVHDAALTADQLNRLSRDVGQLYDGAAGPSGLRLPYQLQAWRLSVDHSELTTPVGLRDDGLRIVL